MKLHDLPELLNNNSYPGRGIVLGKSADGEKAVIAYFIMGRSENSRNRVFTAENSGIKTKAFDPDKLTDPSLIIYSPVRVLGNHTIVTNGDQTDTIYHFMTQEKCFEDALRTRTFEPDAPNFTPRISGVVSIRDGSCSYKLSILKSNNGDASSVLRFFYDYVQPVTGQAHFIHTYACDGNPIPSYEGEPKGVSLSANDLESWTEEIWNSLNADNKVSLFTRFIDLKTGNTQTKIMNKNR